VSDSATWKSPLLTPESARCIYGVLLPVLGVLLAWLATYVTYQRKHKVSRVHVMALLGLVVIFLGLGVFLGTILVVAADSEAIAETGGFRAALRATGILTAAAMGLFVAVPVVFQIAQSWGVHISGIR